MLPILSLAACSSQPAMAPGHVAELDSGMLVINIPRDPVRVKSRVPMLELLSEAVVIAVVAGPEFGAAISEGNSIHYSPSSDSPALRPYGNAIAAFPFPQDFRVLGDEVADAVPWIGQSSEMRIMHEPDGIGAGAMRHIVEAGKVNAIAFVQPAITFTRDMSRLDMRASISVYAKGVHGAVFLDGGALTAFTSLQNAGAPLTPDEMDDVDAGRGFMKKVRTLRARLWFANHGERFNIAVLEDLRLIRQRLVDYFHGRRSGDRGGP